MKLLYFGSGEFGLPTLERLARDNEILAIVTQPDKPSGRSRSPVPTPIGAAAAELLPRIPVFKPDNINEPHHIETLRSHNADALVVIAFGQKLGRTLLEDRFAINLHASLLPRWRGAAPIHRAILAGDAETGNSVITLAETMDAGLILGQSHRVIDPLSTAGELHDLLAQDGPALVASVLEQHMKGTLMPMAQDPAKVTKAGKLSKADGWVDWSQGAEECRRRIHGLTPWPGVTVRFRDESLKLLRAKSRDDATQITGMSPDFAPGALLDAPAGEGLVACGGNSVLQLLEVQPSSGRAMSWTDFARGRRLSADEKLIGGAATC